MKKLLSALFLVCIFGVVDAEEIAISPVSTHAFFRTRKELQVNEVTLPIDISGNYSSFVRFDCSPAKKIPEGAKIEKIELLFTKSLGSQESSIESSESSNEDEYDDEIYKN